MKRGIIFFIFLTTLIIQPYLTANAVEKNKKDSLSPILYIQGGIYTGYIYAHHRSMTYLLENYARGAQLRAGWRLNGASDWHHAYRMLSVGVGYMFSDLGSPKHLGYAHSLYGFVDIPIIQTPKFAWTYDLGLGLGYITKKFDINNNPNNRVIGSNLNAFLLISSGVEYKPTKLATLKLDLGLHHLSNGNTNEPNWGVNTVYLMAGVKQKIDKTPANSYEKKIFNDKTWQYLISYGVGFKETATVIGRTYFISDLHFTARRKFSYTNGFGGGVDLMYDGSMVKELKYNPVTGYNHPDSIYTEKNIHNFSPAIHANWSVYLGRVIFDIQFGLYLHDKLERNVFNRWVLEIELTKNISMYGALKSHWGSADYIHIGLIYQLSKKQKSTKRNVLKINTIRI